MLFADTFKSIKFNFKNAIRIQLGIGFNQRAYWTCEGNPAGVHDMRCIWRFNLHKHIKDTKILADTAYIQQYYPIEILTGKKKPRNGTLSESDINYNKIISKQRGKYSFLIIRNY